MCFRAATKTSSFSIETQSSQQHSGASQIDSTGATSQGDGGELAGGEVRMDVTGEEATASDSKMDIGSEAVDEKDEHLDVCCSLCWYLSICVACTCLLYTIYDCPMGCV